MLAANLVDNLVPTRIAKERLQELARGRTADVERGNQRFGGVGAEPALGVPPQLGMIVGITRHTETLLPPALSSVCKDGSKWGTGESRCCASAAGSAAPQFREFKFARDDLLI